MNLKLAAAAAALAGFPVAAGAQSVPSYASQDEQIRGTIASIGGKYTIYVRDERGYVDTVSLHDGTVINPTGLTLEPGQSVTINGRTDGHSFDANEIDTPYNVDAGPYDVGPDAGYVSAYPYYSYYPAYALSYPAFVSLGFGFGYGYGGYGGYYGGGNYYGYQRNGRGGYGGGYGHYGNGYGGAGYGRRYPQGSAYGNGYRAGTTYGRGAATYGGSRGPGNAPHGPSAGYARPSGGAAFHASSGGGGFHGGGGGGGPHH